MIELTHFVAVISNQVKKAQRFIRGFHVDVNFPCKVRFLVHDIAAAQPAQVNIVTFVFVALDH